MHCRADVVTEARQGELGRAAAAPRFGRGFVDLDGQPRTGQRERGHEPVWPGTHHGRIRTPRG